MRTNSFIFVLLIFVFLNSSLGFAQIPISGEINGVLEDTTYLVQGHLFVISGDSLIIPPGAVFLFDSLYRFDIYGYISAVGTEEDSIYFIPNQEVPRWQGMVFNSGSSYECILSYCYFSSAAIGAISTYFTDITISHCTIENNNANWGGGIYVSWCNPLITDCLVQGNISVNNGGGIYCTHSSPIIANCIVTGNVSDSTGGGSGMGGGGICCNHMSSATITNCIIYGNYSYGYGGGVVFNDKSNGSLTDCSIFNNSSQDGGGGLYIGYADPIIASCTFSGNGTLGTGGTIQIEFNALPIITNNIIEGSFSSEGSVNFYFAQGATIEYNAFFNNFNANFGGDTIPEGLGVIAQVNINGDSCDIFHNIFVNPLFSDPMVGNFNLQSASPCIDAGNPLSAPDPDSTICDMGAFYFPQGAFGIYDLSIIPVANSMLLDWSDIPDAEIYHIYRSDSPYFAISTLTLCANTSYSHFIDVGALLVGKYWYKVTWE